MTASDDLAKQMQVRRKQQVLATGHELTPELVRERVNLLQRVMKSIMKNGTHYGTIPGTDKPTLYKAGSEVILTTFRLAIDPEVEDLSTEDCVRYRVRCHGVHQVTGQHIGTGIGECSSDEEKYRWRRATCDEEWTEAPESRRRAVWKRSRNGNFQARQVRTVPADVANTVLKMAKKRAQIDFTLTATAASDIFTQDIEDLPEELRSTVHDGGEEWAEEDSAPARAGNAAAAARVAEKNGNGAADGARDEQDLMAMFAEVSDTDGLNEVNALIKDVADPDARARLRKEGSRVAKRVYGAQR